MAARRTLSTAAIVAAARHVADAEGLAELTLRRVARELGTGQASLYRHIADRDQLLALLADDLATGYPLVTDGDDPAERVLRQFEAMHAYLAGHPWGAEIIASGRYPLPSARPASEHSVALLRATGLDRDTALRTYRALWHLLLGHLLNAHPIGHLQDARPEEPDLAWAIRALLAGALA